MLKYVRFVAAASFVLTAFMAISAHAQKVESYALQKMQHTQAVMAADARQQKMINDANQLLAMAQQLKLSVDQTRKDELSIDVIRQADQIERLAKQVKDRMRQ